MKRQQCRQTSSLKSHGNSDAQYTHAPFRTHSPTPKAHRQYARTIPFVFIWMWLYISSCLFSFATFSSASVVVFSLSFWLSLAFKGRIILSTVREDIARDYIDDGTDVVRLVHRACASDSNVLEWRFRIFLYWVRGNCSRAVQLQVATIIFFCIFLSWIIVEWGVDGNCNCGIVNASKENNFLQKNGKDVRFHLCEFLLNNSWHRLWGSKCPNIHTWLRIYHKRRSRLQMNVKVFVNTW